MEKRAKNPKDLELKLYFTGKPDFIKYAEDGWEDRSRRSKLKPERKSEDANSETDQLWLKQRDRRLNPKIRNGSWYKEK